MNILVPAAAGLFLYFPEDKTEYIPAGITCLIFLLAAFAAMRIIIRISRKEALKTKKLEEELISRSQKLPEDMKR